MFLARSLAAFRGWLDLHPQIALAIRAIRGLIHFGPWRGLFRWIIRATYPPRVVAGPSASVLPTLDVRKAVTALHRDGVFMAGILPPALLARLREVSDRLPLNAYTHMHEANDDVRALVTDLGVLAVPRAHFGSEPVLLECSAVVHHAGPEHNIGPTSQRRFHFDFAGWQSLNLFVYLTDVDSASAPHEIAVGTHRSRSMRDAIRPSISDEEAFRRFGSAIRTITGPAGTVFFEDTEAFHRRGAAGQRRVILNILFASHRGILSRGRPGMQYADYLKRIGG